MDISVKKRHKYKGHEFKRTGEIWTLSNRKRMSIINQICKKLRKDYGRPRLGNPIDPLDDLIFIILSNKTSPKIAISIYKQIKDQFPSWKYLLASKPGKIRKIIEPAGLSKIKTSYIKKTLSIIKKDFGRCDLSGIKIFEKSRAEEYISNLPGASTKVAKCVCMYTLNAHVLPVDSHVHRIASRLGWTSRKRADQCHEELEALVPPKMRYAFHVDCIIHGRKICRPRQPNCEICHIRSSCLFFKRNSYGKQERKANRGRHI